MPAFTSEEVFLKVFDLQNKVLSLLLFLIKTVYRCLKALPY